MSDERKLLLWVPLVVLWIATMVVRFVPSVQSRFSTRSAQLYATVVGWLAIAGIVVIWLL